jgi:hypothetical protein
MRSLSIEITTDNDRDFTATVRATFQPLATDQERDRVCRTVENQFSLLDIDSQRFAELVGSKFIADASVVFEEPRSHWFRMEGILERVCENLFPAGSGGGKK